MGYRQNNRFILVAVLLSIVLTIVGLTHFGNFKQDIWCPEGFLSFILYSVAYWVGAILLYRLYSSRFILIITTIAGVFYIASVGMSSTVAVVYLFISSACFGSLLVGCSGNKNTFWLDVSAGMAGLLAVFGSLIHFRVNSAELYVVLLSIPILLRLRYMVERLSSVRILAQSIICYDKKTLLVAACFLYVAIYIASGALLPTVTFDALAYHQLFQTQLLYHHRYLFDVQHQLWSTAPWGADLLYAIPYLISGQDCRGFVNLGYGIGIVSILAHMLPFPAKDTRWKIAGLTLFVSTPLCYGLLSTMQTEMALAYIALAGFSGLTINFYHNNLTSRVRQVLLVCGVLLSLKTTGVFLAIPLAIVLLCLVYVKKSEITWQDWFWKIIPTLIMAVFVAFHSYVMSYYLTGNPVFPLFNGIFKSSFWYVKNFFNPRFSNKITWYAPFELTFNTSKFYESRDAVFGMQNFFFILPATVATLFLDPARRRLTCFALIFSSIYAVPVYISQQYIRYLFPILPIITLFLLTPIYLSSIKTTVYSKLFAGSIAGLVILNLFFSPGIGWQMKAGAFFTFFSNLRNHYISIAVPEKKLNDIINALDGCAATVFYEPDRPFAGGLAGTPVYSTWYNHNVVSKIRALNSQDDFARLLEENKVNYYIHCDSANKWATWSHINPFAVKFLFQHGNPIIKEGPLTLYRIYYQEPGVEREMIRNNIFNKGVTGWSQIGHPLIDTVSNQAIVDKQNYLYQQFPTNAVNVADYHALIKCGAKGGSFIVHVNWYGNISFSPVYETVDCPNNQTMNLKRTLVVPLGAHTGELYLQASDNRKIVVKRIELVGK